MMMMNRPEGSKAGEGKEERKEENKKVGNKERKIVIVQYRSK